MNPVLQGLHSMHSTHGNFSNRLVQKTDLNTILEASVQAANASGRQSYSIIVLEGQDKTNRVLGNTSSCALVFCIDFNRIIRTAHRLNHTFDAQGIVSFLTASVDTCLAAQNAAIAAHSLGIDSLFTNVLFRKGIENAYAELALPHRYCFPLITLMLGYAKTEPSFTKGRLKGTGIVHYGYYHELTPEEIGQLISEYDDPEKHLGLIQDWAQQGLRHYLDWFYTKWSGPSNRDKNEKMEDTLQEAGFLG